MRENDLILQTVSKVAVFIILTFGVYLFLAGHHHPGGGFIGGLTLSSAFVLLYLAFDVETINKGLPFDYKKVAALGVIIATLTGTGSLLFGSSFLSQTFAYFNLPIFGKTELATVMLFESGVALGVIGVVVTIIISISEDV
ncbi:Na(+)/H(+) antiporter subunit B [Domibacillus sp. 8LH]|uniref:Na(+)/H(+) antiporter subunit B n=1 Tax=unclassified Domibacillus TaxID=2632383 RepID=UPI0028EE0AF4|nr:Na(+)/H(+) antiporter subunit B [Domibacillus sp. DTU_2020_1001157_1_SI_ALB_TIR_016]WNS78940.1 Na(+)/H(+) antiporter subunit B [Domibacillus sp. DTU_2020_1001157_1_SI_ALB_TIR_016]